MREPRVRVVPLRGSGMIAAAARLVASDIERRGGVARLDDRGRDIDGVLAAENADAIVAIGGTGSGRNDASVSTLARLGSVEVHGIALSPGETAAFGFVGARPVLLLPGRLDAALAVWLAGRPAHAGASIAAVERATDATPARLARKVASTVGMAELVPVRRAGAAPSRWRRNICRCTALGASRRLDPGAGRQRRLSRPAPRSW